MWKPKLIQRFCKYYQDLDNVWQHKSIIYKLVMRICYYLFRIIFTQLLQELLFGVAYFYIWDKEWINNFSWVSAKLSMINTFIFYQFICKRWGQFMCRKSLMKLLHRRKAFTSRNFQCTETNFSISYPIKSILRITHSWLLR